MSPYKSRIGYWRQNKFGIMILIRPHCRIMETLANRCKMKRTHAQTYTFIQNHNNSNNIWAQHADRSLVAFHYCFMKEKDWKSLLVRLSNNNNNNNQVRDKISICDWPIQWNSFCSDITHNDDLFLKGSHIYFVSSSHTHTHIRKQTHAVRAIARDFISTNAR